MMHLIGENRTRHDGAVVELSDFAQPILAGKFIGHLIILALATTAGYGLAGITLQLANGSFDLAAWKPFALLIIASVILGAAFLSMGYLISAKVKERGTAAGIAIGVWLFFVVISIWRFWVFWLPIPNKLLPRLL